jgi:ADP-L-glycero-D-manno-heptose 6-epimerase
MLRALVTGFEGFVGSNLFRDLQSKGYEVFGIDKEYLDYDEWEQELNRRLDSIGPDVIFHVGACSDTLSLDVQDMMIKNYESTKVLVDWTKRNNKKIIYSSSAANYGINNRYPSNLYGWSKYVGEGYVVSNGGIALRYFNVFGPGEENKGKMSSFYYQTFLKINRGEVVRLFPLKPSRDFIYIEDVISANLHALANYEKLVGNYYEVSTGISETFENFIFSLSDEYAYMDESDIPVGYQFYTCGNKSKWMDGWQPRSNLKESTQKYNTYLVNQRK